MPDQSEPVRPTQPAVVEPSPQERRQYSTPQLTSFGDVRELTAGGSGSKQEKDDGAAPNLP